METMAPREYAQAAEGNPTLPPGTAERFFGYALMGMPFSTGHYLAYRRFTASSVGPDYHAVWLRRPDGRWTIYADVPPEFSCHRYFGAAFSDAVDARVSGEWSGPFALTITVPGILRWELALHATPATGMIGAMAGKMPSALWGNDHLLGLLGGMMGPLLRGGKMGLAGLVPNGQSFRAHPLRVWLVESASAVIDGQDAGEPEAFTEQQHLADFWLPQRGMFVAETSIVFPSTAPAERVNAEAGRSGENPRTDPRP